MVLRGYITDMLGSHYYLYKLGIISDLRFVNIFIRTVHLDLWQFQLNIGFWLSQISTLSMYMYYNTVIRFVFKQNICLKISKTTLAACARLWTPLCLLLYCSVWKSTGSTWISTIFQDFFRLLDFYPNTDCIFQ